MVERERKERSMLVSGQNKITQDEERVVVKRKAIRS
jgi:hypothetical protein